MALGRRIRAKIWARLDHFEGGSRLETWLYGFCCFGLREHASSRCRSREKSWDDALDHTAAWDPPIDPTEVRSSNEFVLQHLERLGSPASEVIRMKLFQDMSFEVVAEALEAPTGTVKGWYYRGLDRIRDWVSMEAAL